MDKKIKITKQSDMDEGWRKLAQDMKRTQGYDLAGKPPKIGEYSSPRAGKPQKPDEHGMNFPDTWGVKKQKPFMMTEQKLKPLEERREEKKEEKEELYWSSDDWENWAFQIYKEYPEMKKYLPDWFIEEIEKETEQ